MAAEGALQETCAARIYAGLMYFRAQPVRLQNATRAHAASDRAIMHVCKIPQAPENSHMEMLFLGDGSYGMLFF